MTSPTPSTSLSVSSGRSSYAAAASSSSSASSFATSTTPSTKAMADTPSIKVMADTLSIKAMADTPSIKAMADTPATSTSTTIATTDTTDTTDSATPPTDATSASSSSTASKVPSVNDDTVSTALVVTPSPTQQQQQQQQQIASPGTQVPNASLFIGDLDPNVTEAMLVQLFSSVGPLLSVRVCRDVSTRNSLGYGYVNFVDSTHAETALATLNYTPLLSRSLRLMWSQRDPSLRRSGEGNIVISNLDKSIDSKALRDTFSHFGNILSCIVVCDDAGVSKGYGFVHFETLAAADAAVSAINGMLLNDVKVTVAHHVSKKHHQFQQQQQQHPLLQHPFPQSRNLVTGTTVSVPPPPPPSLPAVSTSVDHDAAAASVAHSLDATVPFTNIYIGNIPKLVTKKDLEEKLSRYGTIISIFLPQDPTDASLIKGYACVNFVRHEDARRAVELLNNTRWLADPLTEQEDVVSTTEAMDVQKEPHAAAPLKEDRRTSDSDNDSLLFVVRARPRAELAAVAAATATAQTSGDATLFPGAVPPPHVMSLGGVPGSRFPENVNLYVKNLDDGMTDDKLRDIFVKFGPITSATVMRDPQSKISRGFGFVCFARPEDAAVALQTMNNFYLGKKPLYVSLAQRKQERRVYIAQRMAMASTMIQQQQQQSQLQHEHEQQQHQQQQLQQHYYGAGRHGHYAFPMYPGGNAGYSSVVASAYVPAPGPLPSALVFGSHGPDGDTKMHGPNTLPSVSSGLVGGPHQPHHPPAYAGYDPSVGPATMTPVPPPLLPGQHFRSNARNTGRTLQPRASRPPPTQPQPHHQAHQHAPQKPFNAYQPPVYNTSVLATFPPADRPAFLSRVEPVEEAKIRIGEYLYYELTVVYGTLNAKLTGMLLSMDMSELVALVTSDALLEDKAAEAYEQLKASGEMPVDMIKAAEATRQSYYQLLRQQSPPSQASGVTSDDLKSSFAPSASISQQHTPQQHPPQQQHQQRVMYPHAYKQQQPHRPPPDSYYSSSQQPPVRQQPFSRYPPMQQQYPAYGTGHHFSSFPQHVSSRSNPLGGLVASNGREPSPREENDALGVGKGLPLVEVDYTTSPVAVGTSDLDDDVSASMRGLRVGPAVLTGGGQ